MTPEEREICLYLKTVPGQFVPARDIARHAGGKWRYRENPDWALPVLARLLERKVIETDSTHQYRLIVREENKKAKKFVSPQMKKLLEKSGKDFTHIIGDDELKDLGF